MQNNKFFIIVSFFLAISLNSSAYGLTYALPENPANSLIGDFSKDVIITTAKEKETLLDIARRFDLGQNEILLANPQVDRWLPGKGTQVNIPNKRLLPDGSRAGVILNLPEYRLYYFHPNPDKTEPAKVSTYPISIGRQDWETPLGVTKIIEKKENPTWTPPESIKKEHAAKGEILPDVIPAGADNPLGLFALRLGIPGYLIHSTNKPYGVGMRVSHGCIRMYPEDIEQLFSQITLGTPVEIVNQAIKVGWKDNTLYIEIYPVLEGEELEYDALLQTALDLIEKANNEQIPVLNGQQLNKALREKNGRPVAIFERNYLSNN